MGQNGKTMLSSHQKTLRMTQLAILTAITALLSFFMIPIGIFEITLAMLPVAVGAVILGPWAGLFLGFVFGICSFITCFGLSPLGTMLLAEQPFFTFLVCVPTRALMGVLVGFIYIGVRHALKNAKNEAISASLPVTVASLVAPLLNTVFFLGMFALLFFGGSTWLALESGNNIQGLFQVIFFMTGLNALVEFLVSAFIGTAVILAILKFQTASHHY